MFYNNDQIQDMITKCKKDAKLRKAVVANVPEWDKRHVQDVIDDGWYERFDRYDSAVCDEFIRAYEKCTGKQVKEANLKDYELEIEVEVTFDRHLSFAQLQSIVGFMNSYFGSSKSISGDTMGLNTCIGISNPPITPGDVGFDDQFISLLLYYKFKGHIDWDENGIGQSFYVFEGAPDEEMFEKSLKSIICKPVDVDLRPENVKITWVGKTIPDLLDEIVEYESIGEYEALAINAAKSIVEGVNIRKTLLY